MEVIVIRHRLTSKSKCCLLLLLLLPLSSRQIDESIFSIADFFPPNREKRNGGKEWGGKVFEWCMR